MAGFGHTGASLINLVLLIVPLMGLTLGALSLASERERGTLLYLLAQPITQGEVLLGKYLGLTLALCIALLLGFGISGLLIAWQGGGTQVGDYVAMVILAFLLAEISLSLGFLISAAVRKGATAVGLALFLWLLLVFFGDLGLMGTALTLRIDIRELFALALLNPLQVFKMATISKRPARRRNVTNRDGALYWDDGGADGAFPTDSRPDRCRSTQSLASDGSGISGVSAGLCRLRDGAF